MRVTNNLQRLLRLKMNPKVSIIVPVYNAEKHLSYCLDSLINQTLKEIEVLLILDCPTDGSELLAQNYAEKDSRIKILKNKRNLHIGFSRNVGIDNAKGEYIGFSDDDDFCEPEMFEKLYLGAKENDADIVVSNYCNIVGEKKDVYSFPKMESLQEFKKQYFEALIRGSHSQANTCSFNNVNPIWNQIFRRELICKNEIYFPDNKLVTFEDVVFNIKAHYFAKKVNYVSEVFYHHIINEKNAYANYDYLSVKKVSAHCEQVYNFLSEVKVDSKVQTEFALCTLKRLYTSFRNEIKFKKITASFDFFKLIKNNAVIQQILQPVFDNNTLIDKLPFTKRLFVIFIKK